MARRPYRMNEPEIIEPYRGDRSEVTAAIIVFLGAVVALAAFIWFGAEQQIRAGLLLTAVLGCVTGWGVGILLTPYKSTEVTSDLPKVLLAGLIGYLVAKLNTLADVVAGLGANGVVALPTLPYAAVALTMFISALALTYVHRTFKMSQPAREIYPFARVGRQSKAERRESPARRAISVPRLPIEGGASRASEADEEAEARS